MIPGLLLAFLSGAIALSYEILWYRAFSFASGGRGDTFGLLLGAYLVGLALGSLGIRRYCRDTDRNARHDLIPSIVLLTLVANTVGFFVVPALGWTLTHGLAWEYGLVLVALSAAGLGTVFPLIAHVWIDPDDDVGAKISYLYLGNILGSALGSLLTGFVLTDHLSLAALHLLLFFMGLGMTSVLLFLGPRSRLLPTGAVLVAFGVLGGSLGSSFFIGIYEKLQEKIGYSPERRFTHIVETKSGVITVNGNDQLFGGGIYDGAFNTSLRTDKNSILRCYALAQLHRSPEEALMIGLGSGSWATIVANNPAVKHLTVVEINAGYLQLLPRYPAVAGLLHHPKVTLVIDDGRRWIIRNSDRRFDLIVANATFNWRSNASNLLSREFLELIRSRLKPGGLYYYNTTESLRVVRTGCTVFPHALKVGSFLAVSDSPLELDSDQLRELLYRYPWERGVALDRAQPEDVATMERLMRSLNRMIRTRTRILESTPVRPLITDDNMGTEWEAIPELLP
ncbi:MAG TPA: fused MFS/spermidine synthase [Planctomycetota bacterium]|nr:fused MFS/spermidine synthase [Planctomycetota bacterium]